MRPWIDLTLGLLLFASAIGACRNQVIDSSNVNTGGHGEAGACSCSTCCGQSLCPTKAPKDGSACNQIGLACEFDAAMACPFTVRCEAGAWHAGPPTAGAPCTSISQPCAYPSKDGCTDATAACDNDIWSITTISTSACCDGGSCCTPSCPSDPPAAGSSCTVGHGCDPSTPCQYPAPCNANATLDATCESGVWQLDKPTDCGCVGATKAECKARSACRWVGPACGTASTIPTERCEPIAGCASPSDCPDGDSCTPIAVNPCPGGQCGSCSVVVPECLSPAN